MQRVPTVANLSGTIALRTHDGRYMKVFNTDGGLQFRDRTLDDNARFIVVKDDYGRVSLKGPNGKTVNLYYSSNVMCSEETGIWFEVAYLGGPWIHLIISGKYQGVGSTIRYLSSDRGHQTFSGSLDVREKEDPSCWFLVENLD
ncbi:hypothetical protein EDC04DRAFT_2776182 [Pisolithus marmoratus]|nr:hypothetical protein EDC04DRAFT_2776182 [Pisolithus marmoratus]